MHSVFLVEAHLMGAYIEYKYDGTRESVYCVEKRKYFGNGLWWMGMDFEEMKVASDCVTAFFDFVHYCS